MFSTTLSFLNLYHPLPPPHLSRHICIPPISIYLSIYLFIHLSIQLSIYLSIYPIIYLPIYLSIHLSISLNISIYVPTCLSINVSIYLSIYLSAYLFIRLSIYPFIYLLIYLSIELVCITINRFYSYLDPLRSLSTFYFNSNISMVLLELVGSGSGVSGPVSKHYI